MGTFYKDASLKGLCGIPGSNKKYCFYKKINARVQDVFQLLIPIFNRDLLSLCIQKKHISLSELKTLDTIGNFQK